MSAVLLLGALAGVLAAEAAAVVRRLDCRTPYLFSLTIFLLGKAIAKYTEIFFKKL